MYYILFQLFGVVRSLAYDHLMMMRIMNVQIPLDNVGFHPYQRDN